jgi:predicted transposase/invertase (TIGR01784 family)
MKTPLRKKIIDLIETIVLYKFPQMSRGELAAMFSINDLRQTRFYQEVLQEGREEGWKEGKLAEIPVLRELGLTDEKIAEILGLALELVQSVKPG